MGAERSAAYLQEIEDIETQLQRNGTKLSSEAREDIALCKKACRAARRSLAKNDPALALLRIVDAKFHQERAQRAQKQFEDHRDKIADDLLATLPEARRRVTRRHYPGLFGPAKRPLRRS